MAGTGPNGGDKSGYFGYFLLIIVSLLMLLVFAFSGCGNGQAGQDNSSAPPAKPAPVINPGQKLFESNCAPCHGLDGKTPTPGIKPIPRDLTNDYVRKKTDQQLKDVISKGLPGSALMVPRPNLSEKDLDELVKFIRSLKK